MLLRLSSSCLSKELSGKFSVIASTRPSKVASNAVPRPAVTLLIASTTLETSETLEKFMPPIAEERPMTVPMKPRSGMAQRNALSRMKLPLIRAASISDWLFIISRTSPLFCLTSKNSRALRMRFTIMLSRNFSGRE